MKHPKDDDRELKHADGTDFDADLRWVHFDYLVNKYKMERQNKYEQLGEQLDKFWQVSKTQQTLPTNREVKISVVAVS